MTYFLMEYDRLAARAHVIRFGDRDTALAALRQRESSREPHVEVVLFIADSLAQLKKTHSRYFSTPEQVRRLDDEIRRLTGSATRSATPAG